MRAKETVGGTFLNEAAVDADPSHFFVIPARLEVPSRDDEKCVWTLLAVDLQTQKTARLPPTYLECPLLAHPLE